jgi:hypothetical protein
MSIYLYEAVCRSDSYDFSDWDGPEVFDTLEEAVNLAKAIVAVSSNVTAIVDEDIYLWVDENGPIVAVCVNSTIEDHRDTWTRYAYGKV